MRDCLLSVAMIVKDEENNIRRALESIKDCVDEIIVVDTGSRDRTPEIVREYTDKLYFHEWRNDFSEARNFSFKFPVCEWVMYIDADEEVSKEFCEKIREFLRSLPDDVNTVFVPIISFLDWDFKRKEFASVARIFRNGTVYFKNMVHNMPVYKPRVVSVPWPWYHYGYIWTRKLRKKKYERTGTLIRKQLQMAKSKEERLYYLVQLYKTETTGGKLYRKSEVAIQTYKELASAPRIPTIALEFMYYFASDLMNLGYFEEAEKLLKKGIEIDPDYPDLYFGMIGLCEKKRDWKCIVEWGEKFFEVLGRILETLDSPRWTVNSMKVTGAASIVIARAHLKLGNIEKAEEWIEKATKHADENGEDIERFLKIFISDLVELECPQIERSVPIVEKIADYSERMDFKIDFSPFLERCVECNLGAPQKVLGVFIPRDAFQKALKARMEDGRDHLLDVFEKESYKDFVESYGANGFVFLFDYLLEMGEKEEKLLKILNEIRTADDERIRGLALAFMGDVYLKMGKFKEALGVYRKVLDTLPAISKFLKPVIEDLKTVITSDMEGVFEEIYKDYSKGMEFIFNIPSILPKEWSRKLHLISDSDHALYTSAVSTDDKEKSRELLGKIKRPEKFPFYYLRLAKTYEGEDWRKSYELHRKACEENEKLADLKYGMFLYHGLYLSKVYPWMSQNDEVVWAGNISDAFSTLDVISPVRMWLRSKNGFYYSNPFPVDEALGIYFRKLKDYPMVDRIGVRIEGILDMIFSDEIDSLRIEGEGFEKDEVEDFLGRFGIEIDSKSKSLLIPFGLETMTYGEFEEILGEVERGIVIFANPTSDSSNVWKYPPFRIIRPIGYLRKILKERGFKVKDLKSLGNDFFALSFSK